MTLIFLHIPKAGGTTFNNILKREFRGKKTLQLKYTDVEKFKNNPQAIRDAIDLLKGHFPFGLHESFSGKSKYITFLRSPVSRVVSYYNYVLETPQHYLYKKVIDQKMTLEEFAVSNLTTEIDNGQIRFLTSTTGLEYKIDENLLDQAKKNIDQFFEVGITERFNESLICFFERGVLTQTPFYFKTNVAKKTKKEIPQDIINLIKDRNKFDVALYDYANSVLEERIKTISDFDSKHIEFEKKNLEYIDKYGGFWYQLPYIFKQQVRKIFN